MVCVVVLLCARRSNIIVAVQYSSIMNTDSTTINTTLDFTYSLTVQYITNPVERLAKAGNPRCVIELGTHN